jgi:hypothetical protein
MTIEEEKEAFEESHHQKLDELLEGDLSLRNWRKKRACWGANNALMVKSPHLKIKDETELNPGEFWMVARYDSGKWKGPALVNSGQSELFPNASWEGQLSEDSKEFFNEQIEKRAKQIGKGTTNFSDKDGWVTGGELSDGAMDAIQSRNFLNDALSQVAEYFKGPPPPEILQAMERAFLAGRYAAECDHEMTKKRANETFETKSTQFKGGERSKGIADQPDAIRGAIAFQNRYPASTQDVVLAYLHGQGATIPRKSGSKLKIRGEEGWITKESFFRRVNHYK